MREDIAGYCVGWKAREGGKQVADVRRLAAGLFISKSGTVRSCQKN